MQEFRRSVWIGFLWSICLWDSAPFFVRLDRRKSGRGADAAISESPWEHLKLLFFPVLVYTVWEYIWVGHRWKGYILTRAEGALLGMLTITALFYTYTGICGRHWLWADILTFVLGAAVTAFWTWKHTPHAKGGSWLGILAVCRRCRLLRDLQSVPADGGDIYRSLKERCHR